MSRETVIYELEKNSDKILNKIADLSYGTSTDSLWEVLGSIKYLIEENLNYINLLKDEVDLEGGMNTTVPTSAIEKVLET